MDLIGQLHQGGTTVMLVTHDEKVARRARRIVHMQDGRIV
jgi:putative ABC transport system ATP-binding protein